MFRPIRDHFNHVRSNLEAFRASSEEDIPLDPGLVASAMYLSAAAITALLVLLALAVVTMLLFWIYVLLAIIGIFV